MTYSFVSSPLASLRPLQFATVTTGLLALSALSLHAQSTPNVGPLLLEYRFNETGTTANAGGSLSGTAPQLTMQTTTTVGGTNAPGTPTDLHSANGGGVSGTTGDRAFDNTITTSTGSGGRAVHGTTGTNVSDFDGIDGLQSFTLQGWFNASAGAGGRIMENRASNAGWQLLYSGGALSFEVDAATGASSARSLIEFNTTDTWIFFAVTYDGSLTANNVNFYKGTLDSPVALVGSTLSLNQGAATNEGSRLILGNGASAGNGFERGFDALLDNVRIYGAASGNTGALNQASLEQIRSFDAVPEPSSWTALMGGVAMLTGLCRIRRRS